MEKSSNIARLAYTIERLLQEGKSIEEIKYVLPSLQGYVPGLELIDAFFDSTLGTSGCAFRNTETGEVIVGFAGTNPTIGAIEYIKDIISDTIIELNGMNPSSPQYVVANNFIEKLKESGYTIDQVTGHSLGGNIAAVLGMHHNIPLIVTYNGAPLYSGLTVSLKNQLLIGHIIENYKGNIIRFVSEEDLLNKVPGEWAGNKFLLNNYDGHDIKGFTREEEKIKISKIINMQRELLNKKLKREIDIDSDGIIDIKLDAKDLVAINLLATQNSGIEAGSIIKISPESLKNVHDNLLKINDNDIELLRKSNNKCIETNLKQIGKFEQRKNNLNEKIVYLLNEMTLQKVLNSIDNSLGILEQKTNLLDDLSILNTYQITRKFDDVGVSGRMKWYLDEDEFDTSDFNKHVKAFQETARILSHVIKTGGEALFHDTSGREIIYEYDTLSKISQSIVNITNSFSPEIENVFKGDGLRSKFNDGITMALKEIFEVFKINIEEIFNEITGLANMSLEISQNFKNFDEGVQRSFKTGLFKFEPHKYNEAHKAKLEKSQIFDDVYLIKALDAQVEKTSQELSKIMFNKYDDILTRFSKFGNNIASSIEHLNIAHKELIKILNKNITSKEVIYNEEYDYYENPNDFKVIVKNHGLVKEQFDYGTLNNIIKCKNEIIPLLEPLLEAMYLSKIFNDNINDLKNHLNQKIEEAIYEGFELQGIIDAQKINQEIFKKIKTQINGLNNQIKTDLKSKTVEGYILKLENLDMTLDFQIKIIHDCFKTIKN